MKMDYQCAVSCNNDVTVLKDSEANTGMSDAMNLYAQEIFRGIEIEERFLVRRLD
jgi:hypothetical protein